MKKIAVLAIALSLIGGVALAPASMAAAPTRSISVNAEGTVKVTPDAVRMSATATVVAASNKEALAETAKAAAAVRTALLANGVAKTEIATQSISSYPEYSYTPEGGSKLIGYAAGPLLSDNVITRPSFTPNNFAYDNALARAFLTAAVRAARDDLLASSTNGETPVTCKLSPPAATTASTTAPAFSAFLIVTTKPCDPR